MFRSTVVVTPPQGADLEQVHVVMIYPGVLQFAHVALHGDGTQLQLYVLGH
jgi:hypothetical protein